MEYAYSKTFIITGDFKAVLSNWQTNTSIFLVNGNSRDHYVYMDIDKWTEFKKSINAIDEEFRKRFNYQFPVA